MASKIGIKIANGEFYPIMDEGEAVKKRLVLTTVHNGQESAQIDLYRSAAGSMRDAEYIGTLVVEDIKLKEKGKPSVELLISATAEGDISAEARDIDCGKDACESYLSVSLKTLAKTTDDVEFNDVEFEEPDALDAPPPDLDNASAKDDEDFEIDYARRERGVFPAVFIAAGVVLLLAAGFCLWFFAFGGKNTIFKGDAEDIAAEGQGAPQIAPPLPPAEEVVLPVTQGLPPEPPPAEIAAPEPPPAAPVKEPEPASAAQTSAPAKLPPPPAARAPSPPPEAPPPSPPVKRVKPPAPVQSYPVPAVIPPKGVLYTVRWGDTLWDISLAFYKTPAYYNYLARQNGIKNPNRLLVGRTIRIPKR